MILDRNFPNGICSTSFSISRAWPMLERSKVSITIMRMGRKSVYILHIQKVECLVTALRAVQSHRQQVFKHAVGSQTK